MRLHIIVLWLLLFSSAAATAQGFVPAANKEEMTAMLRELAFDPLENVRPGRVYHIKMELLEYEKELFRKNNREIPAYLVLSIGIPKNFDPTKSPKFLYTSVTGDIYAPNAYSIRNYYSATLNTDWIVISSDADTWPEIDSVGWRTMMFGITIRYLNQRWKGFRESPIAFAGYSGGAKMSAQLAYFSKKIGFPPSGIFLGGCNEFRVKEVVSLTGMGKRALFDVPVFYSLGKKDPIANVSDSRRVIRKMKRIGFIHQKEALHEGGHRLVSNHVLQALEYFETLL